MTPGTDSLESTLERHLSTKELSVLLSQGWKMVETLVPDEQGNVVIVLERDEP